VSQSSSRLSSLFAAKKNKKKVLKASGATPANPAAPRRVSSDMNVSVRKQIMYAKAYKRLVSNTGSITKQHSPRVRKEKAPKAEKEDYYEIDYVHTAPPLLFVDGYNIIGHINSEEGRSIALDEARDCLVSDLCVLASATGWAIECVFDAYDNRASAAGARVQQDGISVYYTSQRETADDYIERRMNEIQQRRQGASRSNVVVATDDFALRSTAIGLGMGFLTAGMVLEELRLAYRGWQAAEEQMEQQMRRVKPTVGGAVSLEMRAAIREMMRLDSSATGGGGSDDGDGGDGAAMSVSEEQGAYSPPPPSSSSSSSSVDLTADNVREVLRQMEQEQMAAALQSKASTDADDADDAVAVTAGGTGLTPDQDKIGHFNTSESGGHIIRSTTNRKGKARAKARAIDVTAGNLQEIMLQMQREQDGGNYKPPGEYNK
jgi:predicted RNA-binding protein with PIN domain